MKPEDVLIHLQVLKLSKTIYGPWLDANIAMIESLRESKNYDNSK